MTRSANDAAVVIAEAIAGDEDDFAKLMTRKARALGMSKTIYRNASGLPNDEQVTTARDQATLGRAIQDRFPRYYRYFATTAFNYRGQSIRNHNRLLGNVEGVDGIKTGYTRASGFNLVTSMRRGNRHLVGVVLGGRSGGSRDATMRNLLAENLEKGATKRTVAAITERNPPTDANADVAEAEAASRPAADGSGPGRRSAAAEPGLAAMPTDAFDRAGKAVADGGRRRRPAAASRAQGRAASQARTRAADQRRDPDPADRRDPGLGRTDEAGQGQDGSGQGRTDEARLRRPVAAGAPPVTNAIRRPPRSRRDLQRRGGQGRLKPSAKAEAARPKPLRAAMPPQPAGHGTGHGVLGVLPASSLTGPPAPASQAMAYADPAPRRRSRRPSSRTAPSSRPRRPSSTPAGSSRSARWKAKAKPGSASMLPAARPSGLLSKADPFTEPVVAKDNRKLFRARFAGLERDQAEAVCRTLKRADISCITVRN